jgi:hypothetical protein
VNPERGSGRRGRSGKERLWRAGGVALSFATDVAGLLGAGARGLIPR